MKSDLTRSTFRPERHYSGVRMQQGRVQLDADWNEHVDIRAHLGRTAHGDLIGPCGVPKEGGGFEVSAVPDGSDLLLTTGRLYVDGTLCELDATAVPLGAVTAGTATVPSLVVDGLAFGLHQWIELAAPGAGPFRARITAVDQANRRLSFAPALSSAELADLDGAAPTLRRLVGYTVQPHLPAPPDATAGDPATPPVLDLSDGTYLAYVDVWERHLTALDDGGIREIALGGPDTATRTQTAWQLRLDRLGDTDLAVDCDSLPGWDAIIPGTTGRLAARAHPETTASDLCTIPPGAGYRRLENQLYRVEVHEAGDLGSATFKWSRENGSVVVGWTGKTGERLSVTDLGRDAVLGFAAGDWVELTDDAHELGGTSGTMVKLKKPDAGDLLIDSTTASGTVDLDDFPVNPKIRRWDDPAGIRTIDVPGSNDGWLLLEDGVEVRFEDGDYQVGDHWLIPARTDDGDVDWPRDALARALTRPPDGVSHRYCALALVRVDSGSVSVLEDCRPRFPSLTTICAEDVCFDNAVCDLPGVETVQEVLDHLCTERDLRHHNKHLHGWGIVCGLEVSCGTDEDDGTRRRITVGPGYAIDCDGNDILLGQEGQGQGAVDLDVIKMTDDLAASDPENPPLDEQGDGEVCLILDPDSETATGFRLERYGPSSDGDLQSLLGGTLLLDFYNDCIKPIEDFLREELSAAEGEKDPAGPAHQRIAAFTNLLAQQVNPQTGATIYLSPREHEILLGFYTKLRALLQSETFCAMFDDARPFPGYLEGAPEMDTIFGAGNHVRVRMRPESEEAYTVGAGLNPLKPVTLINRFDLNEEKLMARIDPLAGEEVEGGSSETGAAAVQDVAFSPDGKLIHAIVPAKGGQNTFFRTGQISKTTIKWGPVVTICDVRLLTLATTAADPSAVYAVGEGQGLYRIDPDDVDPNADPVAAFNAFGHLVIAEDGRAFATADQEGGDRKSYGRIMQFRLPAVTVEPELELPAEGVDDIAIATEAEGAKRETLYPVIGLDGSNDKYVLFYDMATLKQYGEAIPVDDTAISLHVFLSKQMQAPALLIASEDGYMLRMAHVGPESDQPQLVQDWILPMQVGPISIASDVKTQRLYVLNDVSNTITVVPGELVDPEFRFPLDDLAAYRKGVVEAFVDLMGGFLQYLKDCLCDHFLVKCPECTGDETLYLACVSIRKNEVYKVCNFSRRKYVKSFPTVGYWMSLFPIMPLLDRLVEAFCCLVLPEIFSRYSVAAFQGMLPAMPEPRMRVASVRKGAGSTQAMDLGSRLRESLSRARLGGSLAAGGLLRRAATAGAPEGPPIVRSRELVGQPVDEAAARLADRGMRVSRAPFDPAASVDLLGNIRELFRAPGAGDEVTLYAEEDRVRNFAVRPAEEGLREDVGRLREELATRDEQLESLRKLVGRLERKQSGLQRSLTELQGTPKARRRRQ